MKFNNIEARVEKPLCLSCFSDKVVAIDGYRACFECGSDKSVENATIVSAYYKGVQGDWVLDEQFNLVGGLF